MTQTAAQYKDALRTVMQPEKKKVLSGFFKSGKGEYGEGDIFIGVTVPDNRTIAKSFREMPLSEIELLLHDPIHECRLGALLCLIEKYKKADEPLREEIYRLYTTNTAYINNWDLVDLSAAQIVGEHLASRDHAPLYRFANSSLLWEQRISIVATWRWIRNGQFNDTLAIADILLLHPHDLIQKAVGWMLREVGKCDKKTLTTFLDSRYTRMPRTMLRYAIEKFSADERAHYMKK